jgi:hypothetical protein
MHYSHYVDETRKRRELKQPDPVFWAACDVHPATVRAWDDTERDAWYRRYAACLEWSFMLDYCVVIREYKGSFPITRVCGVRV